MNLRAAGNFKELSHGRSDGPSINDRERYGVETKSRLINYLISAPVLAASGGVVADYFDGRPIGPLNLHTDGHWVWYSDLANYVDKWNVKVEPEFVSHVLSARLEDLDSVDLEAAEDRLFE